MYRAGLREEGDFLPGPVVIGQEAFKLEDGRFRLNIRMKFYLVRVVRHGHGLPREVVDALSVEVFNARLDGALSNLV